MERRLPAGLARATGTGRDDSLPAWQANDLSRLQAGAPVGRRFVPGVKYRLDAANRGANVAQSYQGHGWLVQAEVREYSEAGTSIRRNACSRLLFHSDKHRTHRCADRDALPGGLEAAGL